MKKVRVSSKDKILQPLTGEQLEGLSKKDLIALIQGEQSIRLQQDAHIEYLTALAEETKDQVLELEGKYLRVKNTLYGRSSEKHKLNLSKDHKHKEKIIKDPVNKIQLPSERYPNLDIVEKDLNLIEPPTCECCESQMEDSGLVEESEYLSYLPRKYFIVKQIRHKYRCSSCHGSLVTTPSLPRIKSGSSYSDELMVDVALSKYCDLLPIERYVAMAQRSGVKGLPAQSLIELTHYLADFLEIIYKNLFEEILSSIVLHADETPHRMLEGDEKSSWYLWGFSSAVSCYFEVHDTRSGDIASEVLKKSSCKYLVSDVYSGYNKAVRETNEIRASEGKVAIENAYCNAHARRKFTDAAYSYPVEAEYYIKSYQEIYHEESKIKEVSQGERQEKRLKLLCKFEEMKVHATNDAENFSTKSIMAGAINYLLKNYEGLTLFTKNPIIPIDNNQQERLLRNPVIGRKTWYGTHSIRGSQTAAIHFSIVESCKINQINPREYYKFIVDAIHYKKEIYTPAEYKKSKEVNTG
jgi:transposase